jgi:condensin complex subunit 2
VTISIDFKSYFFAQAADSDYEESDNLFVGPVETFDLTSDPCHSPKTAQENGDTPENQETDITTYGESNLVAEPHKVRMKQLNL